VARDFGGGCYGNPLERDVSRVGHDVAEKWITQSHAEEVYGVVFKAGSMEVDEQATVAKRASMANA